MPTNAAGLRRTKQGTYIYPYVEVDGKWETRSDVEWEPDQIPLTLPKNSAPRNRELLTKCSRFRKGYTFRDRGVIVTVVEPIQLQHGHLTLQVRVSATTLEGTPLDVSGGLFEYVNPVFDTPEELQALIIDYIARTNGMV